MSIEENDALGEQIEELFEGVDSSSFNYNDWEEGFVKDMKDKWDRGTDFSDAQVKQIEKLYSKYIDGDEVEDTYDRFHRDR